MRYRKHSGCLLALIAGTLGISVQAQTTIPASAALPVSAADTSKRGFLWRVHQTAAGQPTTLVRTEAQLAGRLGDNIADPNAQSGADAPGTGPNPSTAPIEFVVSTVINFDQNGSDRGSVLNDTGMPGIPGTGGGTDNIAGEVLTWLELPAGEIVMGVNSDDGFRVTIGGASPQDPFAIRVGEFDGGRGAADSVFRFTIAQAGLYAARVIYNEGGGDASIEWWTQLADGTKVLINDVGGIKAYRAVTGSAAAAVLGGLSPAIGETGVFPNAPVLFTITEGGTAIDPATVTLKLDGTPVSATTSKAGKVITVRHTPASIFAAGSVHQVEAGYSEGGTTKTRSWSFTVANYRTLPPTAKVTPDTSKPGFTWTVFANSGNTTTSNQRAEDALAGLLKDADGNLLPNTADPAAQGVAIAPAAAPSQPNGSIRFEIAGVINMTQNAADDADNKNGNFTPDQQMPGIPGTDGLTDGIAGELVTFIELPAGVVIMGVNSDDGFRTAAGNPLDVFGALRLGEFDTGRGAADTLFSFVVQEAGVYAFRTIWEEGGGGANIEWFTVKADGTKVLVNNTAGGGFKSYRALVGGNLPYIKSVSPTHINRLLNQPSASLTIVIADGTSPVDDNSIALKIDGQAANITKSRSGNTVTVTFTPSTLFLGTDEHTAELSFKNVAGTHNRTQSWKFRNVENLTFPTALVTENFDSYEEGTVPTGWVEKNFTDSRTAGIDLDDLNSDAYLGWVVVSRARLEGLKGRIFNLPATPQKVNGQDVTSLSDGNLLYAESDVRGGNQVQFITSKPFNLSGINNVVMSFSSLYEQNQDSIGAVEYSVDGGANWLPGIYYLDQVDGGGDIDFNLDGTVDAVTTLTSANADTAAWTENGVQRGDRYGDALLAPITPALGVHIAPRINDNSNIDKRVEAIRLPQAGKKSDVRIRFAQLGTGSWYFGVDNISFYEGPAPAVVEEAKLTASKTPTGAITLSWIGGGTLESSDRVNTGYTTHSSQANPQTVTASGGARFFRVRQ